MEKQTFEFSDETKWTNERLKERLQHLGGHILLAAQGTERYEQMDREIQYLVFEMSQRDILKVGSDA